MLEDGKKYECIKQCPIIHHPDVKTKVGGVYTANFGYHHRFIGDEWTGTLRPIEEGFAIHEEYVTEEYFKLVTDSPKYKIGDKVEITNSFDHSRYSLETILKGQVVEISNVGAGYSASNVKRFLTGGGVEETSFNFTFEELEKNSKLAEGSGQAPITNWVENLMPDNLFTEEAPEGSVAKSICGLLQIQGEYLKELTNGLITCEVEGDNCYGINNNYFSYSFSITVPSRNFKVFLFKIEGPIFLDDYDVTVFREKSLSEVEFEGRLYYDARSNEELVNHLKEIMNTPYVRNTIKTLYSFLKDPDIIWP